MPHLTGFDVMEQLAPLISADDFLPILILTADDARETRHRALSLGATDFLTKPFDVQDVLLRVANLLRTRMLHLRLRSENHMLDALVHDRTRSLEEAQIEILERLALAAEYRDDETGHHTSRVASTSALLAAALGLPAAEVELIRQAASLHDVGKIGIPDHILLKPAKLSVAEFEVMKNHTRIGAKMLANGHSPLIQLAATIALMHHERWDGTGYPEGLRGESVPLVGRIVSVADVFDALTHDRTYKQAWTVNEAVAEIQRQSGHQFDPQVVTAFMRVLSGEQGAPRAEQEAAALDVSAPA
ncbi:MAG: two-component system response regulator [Herpetosiphon sp.]